MVHDISGNISNLKISYYRQSIWREIPHCIDKVVYYSVTIYVTPSVADQAVPVYVRY